MNDITIRYNEAGLRELEEKGEEFIQKVADDIRDEAKRVVPVDTGALRDSIEDFDGDNKKEKYIGSVTKDYAIMVELGTVNMDPQPYLVPSLDKVVGEI
jgi:HK97 gp10 family phage protein